MNAETSVEPTLRLAEPVATGSGRWVLDPEVLTRNHIVGFGAMSDHSRPFFMIRSGLLHHATAMHQRVFAVTSAQAGNGKTHIATNLAATLSRIHPTILLELDLHQPSLGQRLGLPTDTPGIDDYLSGEAAWEDTAIQIEGFDLTVHRVRLARVNAGSLLASAALADILKRLRSNSNGPICIVDTPPALIGDDLVLIARGIDGVLLVAEEARSRKRDIIDVANALNPTPIVGTILNNSIALQSRSNSYGYYYQDDREGHSTGAPLANL
ncbi:Mrp family chromosome partitioning ATPase [Novosphingobium sp. PhB165]|uniref:CpsD/CapB family tyrosine-protein kinase n=1 Tax=Novosphingobium sp. PhB165 TaxID=2485105 RepID=UPI0010D57B94|nr:CpsD/CapB family tyrosine-protein kinase [Novosphingobium sp. PhB165]TCM20827.1 Mrp family chromosome partitioning ATPase [Novosphingobium sp. PhB165]